MITHFCLAYGRPGPTPLGYLDDLGDHVMRDVSDPAEPAVNDLVGNGRGCAEPVGRIQRATGQR
jgi:hypothetical protein